MGDMLANLCGADELDAEILAELSGEILVNVQNINAKRQGLLHLFFEALCEIRLEPVPRYRAFLSQPMKESQDKTVSSVSPRCYPEEHQSSPSYRLQVN
jgi:hypothetical protein